MIQIRYGILSLGAALLLMAAGCGGSSSGGAQEPRSVSAVQPSGLTLTLAESAASASVGGSVTYTMVLTNTTDKTVSGTLVGGCAEVLGIGSLEIVTPSGQAD